MRWRSAVLGAGNGGCAVAFDWAQHGHNVAKGSHRGTELLACHPANRDDGLGIGFLTFLAGVDLSSVMVVLDASATN
jgi:predicted dinucleotide-binding enzyme